MYKKKSTVKKDPCVYFLRDSAGNIKIGTTTNLHQRLIDLNIAHAVPLELVFSGYGGRVIEHEIHDMFKEHRLTGEWFNPAQDIFDFIEEWKLDPDGLPARLNDRFDTIVNNGKRFEEREFRREQPREWRKQNKNIYKPRHTKPERIKCVKCRKRPPKVDSIYCAPCLLGYH